MTDLTMIELLLVALIAVAVVAGLRFAYVMSRRDMIRDLYIDKHGEDEYRDLLERFGLS